MIRTTWHFLTTRTSLVVAGRTAPAAIFPVEAAPPSVLPAQAAGAAP